MANYNKFSLSVENVSVLASQRKERAKQWRENVASADKRNKHSSLVAVGIETLMAKRDPTMTRRDSARSLNNTTRRDSSRNLGTSRSDSNLNATYYYNSKPAAVCMQHLSDKEKVTVAERRGHLMTMQKKKKSSSSSLLQCDQIDEDNDNNNHNHNNNRRSIKKERQASTRSLASTRSSSGSHASLVGGISMESFAETVAVQQRRALGVKPSEETASDGVFWLKPEHMKSWKKAKKAEMKKQKAGFLKRGDVKAARDKLKGMNTRMSLAFQP